MFNNKKMNAMEKEIQELKNQKTERDAELWSVINSLEHASNARDKRAISESEYDNQVLAAIARLAAMVQA